MRSSVCKLTFTISKLFMRTQRTEQANMLRKWQTPTNTNSYPTHPTPRENGCKTQVERTLRPSIGSKSKPSYRKFKKKYLTRREEAKVEQVNIIIIIMGVLGLSHGSWCYKMSSKYHLLKIKYTIIVREEIRQPFKWKEEKNIKTK